MQKSGKLFFKIAIGILAIGAGLVLYLNQRELIRLKKENQQVMLTQEKEKQEAIRQNGMMELMSHVLNKMEADLQQHPDRMLSDTMIRQIASLSYALTSYQYTDQDSTTPFPLSTARGQLLLMLANTEMDTLSFQKILSETSFAGAVLEGADLSNLNLSRIDLRGARLKDCNLTGTILRNANLESISMWGAILNKADLTGANISSADLGWSELNDAILVKSDLHDAVLISSKLRKANLAGANLQWTDFSNAILHEANLDSADMFRVGFHKAQLKQAILTNANLYLADLGWIDLTEANLSNTNLHDACVSDKDWLNQLVEWKVIGTTDILEKYHVVDAKFAVQAPFQVKKK